MLKGNKKNYNNRKVNNVSGGRKTTNRFRDMIGDYYLTNREITKEADARYQKEKDEGRQPWNAKEKVMLLITAVALVLIILKYMVF